MTFHAVCRGRIEAHFSGRIAPDDEITMREHLSECSRCRTTYRRRSLLAELEPNALDPYERIGRGLGLLPRKRLPRLAGAWIAAAAAACLLAVAVPRAMFHPPAF